MFEKRADPSLAAVLMEDSATCLGIIIALMPSVCHTSLAPIIGMQLARSALVSCSGLWQFGSPFGTRTFSLVRQCRKIHRQKLHTLLRKKKYIQHINHIHTEQIGAADFDIQIEARADEAVLHGNDASRLFRFVSNGSSGRSAQPRKNSKRCAETSRLQVWDSSTPSSMSLRPNSTAIADDRTTLILNQTDCFMRLLIFLLLTLVASLPSEALPAQELSLRFQQSTVSISAAIGPYPFDTESNGGWAWVKQVTGLHHYATQTSEFGKRTSP